MLNAECTDCKPKDDSKCSLSYFAKSSLKYIFLGIITWSIQWHHVMDTLYEIPGLKVTTQLLLLHQILHVWEKSMWASSGIIVQLMGCLVCKTRKKSITMKNSSIIPHFKKIKTQVSISFMWLHFYSQNTLPKKKAHQLMFFQWQLYRIQWNINYFCFNLALFFISFLVQWT